MKQSMSMIARVIQEGEKIPLNDEQIKQYLHGQVRIVKYGDMTSIEEMLQPYGRYVMLYQFPGQKVGHWVVGFLQDGMLHLFDPYGLQPDEPMEKMGHPEVKTYTNLIHQSPYYPDRLAISKYQYQQFKDGIDTCGRHCISRLLFANLNPENYHDLMTSKLLQNPDERATLITLSAAMPHLSK